MTQYNETDDESKVFKPEMLCDASDEDRFTMILKVNYNGNVYICNRSNNLAIFNHIIKDKYCKWFRIKQINEMKIPDSYVEILEELPYANFELEDQKKINIVKKKYIEMYKYDDDNPKLVNKALGEYKDNIRERVKNKYLQVKETIDELTIDEIYQIIKFLWFNKKQKLEFTRLDILKDKELNWNQKVVAMVFSDYLYDRILLNKFLPFDKGVNISNKINKIIEKTII